MTSPTSRPLPRSARRRPTGRAPGVASCALALALVWLGACGEADARTAAGAGALAARAAAEGNAAATPAQGDAGREGATDEDADAEAPGFFEELDDLPLMEGLQEMPEASMAFDKPGGRIGEVYAEGAVPADAVRAFYEETLPEFGWKPVSENSYERDGERLVLDVSERGGTTTLRLSLSPTD